MYANCRPRQLLFPIAKGQYLHREKEEERMYKLILVLRRGSTCIGEGKGERERRGGREEKKRYAIYAIYTIYGI